MSKRPYTTTADLGHQDRSLNNVVLGFTGTRDGLTDYQRNAIWSMLRDIKPREAHHGDCVGGDSDFHFLCRKREIPLIGHPPEDDRWRAFCEGFERIEVPRPYLARNRIIVNTVQILIAAPKEDYEPPPQRGQGTWSTVRYARSIGRLLRIVWPE